MSNKENVELSDLKKSVLARKINKRKRQIQRVQANNKGSVRHTNPNWGEYHKLLADVSKIILQYKQMGDSVIIGLQKFDEEYKTGIKPYITTFLTDLSNFSATIIKLKNGRMYSTGPVSEEDTMSFYEECLHIQDLTHDIVAVMSPIHEQIVLQLGRIQAKAEAAQYAKTETTNTQETLLLESAENLNDTAN
jgi:hypothetical protein